MVDYKSAVAHLGSNAPIAITASMLMKDRFDCFFLYDIFILGLKVFNMIVKY